MFALRSRHRSLGFGIIEVMTVTGLIAGLHSSGNYFYAINQANEVKGINNLKQIHTLLVAQCIMEKLPDAAFYPKDDPKEDPKSIIRLVKGAVPELFVSPFAPEALKKKGLTFAWNDTVNGKDLDAVPRGTWLLIDLAAFVADPKIPKPKSYLVLYSDGRAVASETLPDDIVKAVNEARAELESSKPKNEKEK